MMGTNRDMRAASSSVVRSRDADHQTHLRCGELPLRVPEARGCTAPAERIAPAARGAEVPRTGFRRAPGWGSSGRTPPSAPGRLQSARNSAL